MNLSTFSKVINLFEHNLKTLVHKKNSFKGKIIIVFDNAGVGPIYGDNCGIIEAGKSYREIVGRFARTVSSDSL